MKKQLLTLLAFTAITGSIALRAAPIQSTNTIVYNFVLTAASSPSNSFSLQNAMSYIDKGGVIGLISTNIGSDPAAINRPHIVRVCDIIWSAPTYYMWDATNGPTGPFAIQNGKRLGWGLDWKQSTPFLASDVYFTCSSTEPANSLYYAGNVATNTADGTSLTFSSTLRGELWNSDGTKTVYDNGEDVASHPINRLMCLIREGYYAADTNTLLLDLNYFKNEMPLRASVRFYMLNGTSANASLSSQAYLDVSPIQNGNDMSCQIEGQRQIGMTYTIQGTPSLRPINWSYLSTGDVDGFSFTGGQYWPDGFFRAMEGNVTLPTSPSALSASVSSKLQGSQFKPSATISNGTE